MPPEEIWHDGERVEEWLDAVMQRRKSGDSGMEPIEDVPMVKNEETERILAGLPPSEG